MAQLTLIQGERCRICGGRICKAKALYYSGDLKNLCVECRRKELDKLMEKK